MIESSVRQGDQLAAPSLARACLALSAAVIVALAAIGSVARERQGDLGLEAAFLAALTCWLSAMAALLLAGRLRNTAHAVSGILGGTLMRTMIPLGVATAFQASGNALAQAGLFGYLVVFFLLTLTIETLLLVWLLRPGMKLSGGARREGGCATHG